VVAVGPCVLAWRDVGGVGLLGPVRSPAPPHLFVFCNPGWRAGGGRSRGGLGAGRDAVGFGFSASGGLSNFVNAEEFDRDGRQKLAAYDYEGLAAIPDGYYQSGTSEVKIYSIVMMALQHTGAQMTLVDYVPVAELEHALVALSPLFAVIPDVDTQSLLSHTSETLASLSVMATDLARELEGPRRQVILTIQQLSALGELMVNRALDNLDSPRQSSETPSTSQR